MRTKEDAADYRLLPDPDLPPLAIAAEWIERVRAEMPELPRAMAERYVQQHGLSEYDATQLTQSPALAGYFDAAVSAGAALQARQQLDHRRDRPPAQPAGHRNHRGAGAGRATGQAHRTHQRRHHLEQRRPPGLRDSLWTGESQDVDAVIESKGLKQMSDSGALEKIIDDRPGHHQKNIDEYRAGKDKAFNALVGQVMKASQGKANPAQVNALLKSKLG